MKRSGHQFRYFVTNIKDYIILDDDLSRSEESEEGELDIEKDLLLPLAIFDNLFERDNLSFHHISLKSRLNYPEDYDRLDWRIKSNCNKGKVFELKSSEYRRCAFVVYPKGTVSMIIKCSNDPLYLTTLDDIANFFSICGQILSVLQAEIPNSEPLVDDVPNWKVTQIDAAFDIPLAAAKGTDLPKDTNTQKGLLSYSNFGTFRLKYLGQFYQLYSKNVLHKNKVLRIEKRFSFLDNQPTVDMFNDRIKNPASNMKGS